jgi:hypothetical protein
MFESEKEKKHKFGRGMFFLVFFVEGITPMCMQELQSMLTSFLCH